MTSYGGHYVKRFMDLYMKIWGISLFVFLHLIIPFDASNGGNSYSSWSEDCKPNSKPEQIQVVGNNADIYISALLDVHGSSRHGIYGCGAVSERGIVVFEAMKWLLSIINQDYGYLNGYRIKESLIPGIKLGIIVFDTCNNKELANHYLTKIYPVLERGADDCEDNGPLYQNAFSVIDLTGVSTDPRVVTLTRLYHLPVIPLNLDSFLPPETVAKTLSQIMVDLKWHQIAVIHTLDEHSLQVIKLLGQASLSQPLCLKYVQSLPSLKEEADLYSKSNSVAFIAILRNVISALPDDVPILVVGSGRSVHRLLEIMSERIDVVSKHQWLLSALPEPRILKPFINSSVNIFSLSSYPGSIGDFEGYWGYLHKHGFNQSFPWFDELVKEKATQDGPPEFASSQLDSLWRTNQIMPLIQTVFILSHAFREAWASRCGEQPGLCPDLTKMTRKEFEANYLGDLRFEDRSLRDLMKLRINRGKKTGNINAVIELALTKLIFDDISGVQYQHMIGFDTQTGKSQSLNKSVVYRPSLCPSSGCDKCLKIRQSRIVDSRASDQDESASSRSIVNVFDDHSLKQEQEQCMEKCANSWRSSGSLTPEETNSGKVIVEESWNQKLEYIHISGGWYLTLAILSALGIILIIICGFYFHLVFPIIVKHCLLEYLVLLGVVMIFSINFVYLLPTSYLVCLIRRLGMPTAYTMVFSALLAKVLSVRRLTALREKGMDRLKPLLPSRLVMIACFLLSLQIILAVIWLFIIPPKPNFKTNTCAWPHTTAFIKTESVVSLVYVNLLAGSTIILSLISWSSPENNREPRWIALSCLLMASVWCVWALGMSYSSQFRYQSNMTTVCANILSALILIMCLYVRNIKLYMKVPFKARQGRTPSQLGLHNSSFSGSTYGTLPKNSKFTLFNGHRSCFRHPNSSNKRSTLSTSFFIPWSSFYRNDQNDDGQSSCASTSGSIQVQAEDLYPMEVFEDADSLQQYHYYTSH